MLDVWGQPFLFDACAQRGGVVRVFLRTRIGRFGRGVLVFPPALLLASYLVVLTPILNFVLGPTVAELYPSP